MFPLYRIVFSSVLEQTIFNGSDISFWAGLEWFLFPSRTGQNILINLDINESTFISKKFIQKRSFPTATQYKNHA